MALPAVMDMVADSQGESGSGGCVLVNDISTSLFVRSRAIIKEKNKMESEIGEYQKTLDEMLTAMANLHQEGYGSTVRIQELERRCEIASKQSGHLVNHHQHHMAEA